MSLSNPKIFGLEVNNLFGDIKDADTALITLNLPPKDLDIIRGSSETVSQTDFVTLSNLSTPLYKTLDRIYSDSNRYIPVLNNSAGFDQILRGNLTVNGRINSNSIRFNFVNGSGSSATIKIGDISTSRSSSWNSTASPVLDTSPIFYGSRVGILTGGQLQFSGGVSGVRLKTSLIPEEKEFNAEIANTKIECNIGGQTINLFAMRGIPLVFRGFFRDLSATIEEIPIESVLPTWRIQEVENPNKKSDFVNRSSNSISYRGITSTERFIKYYYDPDSISTISIRGAGITKIPESVLTNLNTIDLTSNQLKEFPDFAKFTPNLRSLFIANNLFYLSDNSDERKLNQNIVDKIPSSIRKLVIGGNFGGSIPQNIFAGTNLPNMTEFNINKFSRGLQHTLDNNQNPAQLPNVGENVTTYSAISQAFTAFGTTDEGNNQYNVADLPRLEVLALDDNIGLTTSNFVIQSPNITTVDITGTRVPFPDLRNKKNFTKINFTRNRSTGAGSSITTSDGSYKLSGCFKLITFEAQSSNLSGILPEFDHPELIKLNLIDTRIEGRTGQYSISAGTFRYIPKVTILRIQSRSWGVTTPISPSAFAFNIELNYLEFRSFGKTTGFLPTLSALINLQTLVLSENRFSGPIPNFASNPNISYVNLQSNELSGAIPGYADKLSLGALYLDNNRFTSLGTFTNLPNLYSFSASNNDITGEIPDYSGCERLYSLYLNNNEFSTYSLGSFANLTRLSFLFLQNNNLTSTEINKIIFDLFENYQNFPRRFFLANLGNNAPPNGDDIIDKLDFLRNTAQWSITVD